LRYRLITTVTLGKSAKGRVVAREESVESGTATLAARGGASGPCSGDQSAVGQGQDNE